MNFSRFNVTLIHFFFLFLPRQRDTDDRWHGWFLSPLTNKTTAFARCSMKRQTWREAAEPSCKNICVLFQPGLWMSSQQNSWSPFSSWCEILYIKNNQVQIMIVTASYTVKCVFQIFTSGDLFLHHLSATSHNLWIINHRVRQSENGSFSFISFHLDSLLMTRISAPFSSFSRWLSDLSSVKIWDDEGKEMKLGKIKWS